MRKRAGRPVDEAAAVAGLELLLVVPANFSARFARVLSTLVGALPAGRVGVVVVLGFWT